MQHFGTKNALFINIASITKYNNKGICGKTINRKEPKGLILACKDISDLRTCAVALKRVRSVL